jgi:hypothetical protein
MHEQKTQEQPVKKDLKYYAKDTALGLIAWPLATLLIRERNMPVLESMISINMSDGVKFRLDELLKEGYAPFTYSDHISHADGFAKYFALNPIVEGYGFDGIRVPVAKSMEKEQGLAIRIFHKRVKRLLANHLYNMLGVIRPVDRIRYGMEGTSKEEIELIVHARDDNMINDFFPEGKLQGGRRRDKDKKGDKKGDYYGLQPIDHETQGFISLIARYHKKIGKKTVYIPMFIKGTNNIFTPDGGFLTKRFIKEFFLRQNPNHGRPPLAEVEFGMPFTSDDLERDGVDIRNREQLTNYLMNRLSSMMPENMRGAYPQPTDVTT